MRNPRKPTAEIVADGRSYRHVDLRTAFGDDLRRLPWLMRVLAENVLRCLPPENAGAALAAMRGWLDSGRSEAEIPFRPGAC